MFHQIRCYLSFLIHSTTKYGVHSPFVYDLLTKCLNKKTNTNNIQILKKYKKELLKNNTKIKIKDFGAGSRVLNPHERKISNIAKTAGTSIKKAQFLMHLVNYFKIENSLEIGTSLGIATLGMSLGNPKIKITTLEGCSETLKVAKQKFQKLKITNTQFIEGNFEKTLAKTIQNNKYNLIYFDGNHTKKATINYFEQCLPTVYNDSIFIFDDIYWSSGMTDAWQYIKNHKKVTITIDMFYWGIVFFRKEQQEKEHFKIRI